MLVVPVTHTVYTVIADAPCRRARLVVVLLVLEVHVIDEEGRAQENGLLLRRVARHDCRQEQNGFQSNTNSTVSIRGYTGGYNAWRRAAQRFCRPLFQPKFLVTPQVLLTPARQLHTKHNCDPPPLSLFGPENTMFSTSLFSSSSQRDHAENGNCFCELGFTLAQSPSF